MNRLEHDLLLVMLNLSRLRDREMIMRLFVEALSAAVSGVSLRYLEAAEQTEGEVVEVATPEAKFGRIAIEDPAAVLTVQERACFRNAIRMLAVVLENAARAERLATENSRLDKAVAARTADLRRSLAESDDLYHNASCGYHSLDAVGVYVRVNDTELRWLGYGREEVVGRLAFLDLVAEESRPDFVRSFALLKDSGTAQDLELDLIRKDGTRIPVLQSATAVTDVHGRFVMSRATVYDLSERRKADRDLRESEERFWQSQKLEAIGRLAGGIAHDFNNLLTVIIACSEMLQTSLHAEDPACADAKSILDAGQRAAALTRQLLAFARRQPTIPAPTDVGRVVAGMAAMLRRLIGDDVELEISNAIDLRLVQIDKAQLEQVLLNLAVNARDAMLTGGVLRIETANRDLERAGGEHRRCVVLAVNDTGVGISPEARAHLFEPFFTTKEQGKGTGLGLATVYGIVRQAGGSVNVESAAGKGTRFEVLFPASDEQSLPATVSTPGGMYRGTGTILLVDDEPNVRATAARILRAAGYTVLEAADGEQAVAIAARAPNVDLLLTDMVMPRMTGSELASRLVRSSGLKVIFMSGYADGTRLHASPPAACSVTLLEKPFSVSSLTRAVHERLGNLADGASSAD